MRRSRVTCLRRDLLVASPGLLLGIVLALFPGVSTTQFPVVFVTPAFAQESDKGEDDMRDELKELDRQRREKLKKAEELKAKESKEINALRSTEKKERQTKSQIARLKTRQRTLEKDLGTVRAELAAAEDGYERQRILLASRLRGLYKMGRLKEFEYLVSSETFAEFFMRLEFIRRVAEQDRYIMIALEHEKERIGLAREKIDETLGKVKKNTSAKRSQQKKLQSLASDKKKLVASIQNEREQYEAAAEELRRTASQLRRLLADLERQRTGADILPPYEGRFSAGKTQLPWPVNGQVVGRYGNEKHPKWGTVTFNSGIDIAAPIGTDVRSVARGRVDYVSSSYGSYGQLIILNHGEGYYSLYAHCSTILVARGQEVEPRQVIARVGDTGSLKGSILHFEIRKGKSAVNPEEWLR